MEKQDVFRKVINFRDLGGYKGAGGKTIKHGLIYRSGGPSRMTELEIEVLRSLNLKTILDLRAEHEIRREPDPYFEGVNMLRYSGVIENGKDIDFSPQGMNKTGKDGWDQLHKLMTYYQKMAIGNKAFEMMFEVLLNKEVPLLIHCATGKDRTGVAVMLILLALGVDENTVYEDYMLSREYRREILEWDLKMSEERIRKEPVLGELLTIQHAVSENIGLEVIGSIKHRYGTYEEFLEREYGLDSEKLECLRSFYLEQGTEMSGETV